MTVVAPRDDLVSLSLSCGLELSHFRPDHVRSRIERILSAEGLSDPAALVERLREDERLRMAFRRSVAISVTSLFRDAGQFAALRDALGSRPNPRRPVRAWSAGCATGEEAWSIAAVLASLGRAECARVLGSDLLAENVRAARRLAPTAVELDGAVIPRSLRLRFEQRDLIGQGAPGGGWDLILCRNVAIYFDAPQRLRVHALLAASLGRGGLLMLGRSERLRDPRALGLRRIAPHLYRREAA